MRTPRGSPAGYGFRIGKGAFVGRAWTPQLLGIVAGTREAEGENRSVVPGRDRGRGSARIDTFLVTTHGPAEVCPQLRLQYFDQPVGEFLVIAMEPIKTWSGEPIILNVANGGAGLILIGQDGRAEADITVTSRFILLDPIIQPLASNSSDQPQHFSRLKLSTLASNDGSRPSAAYLLLRLDVC